MGRICSENLATGCPGRATPSNGASFHGAFPLAPDPVPIQSQTPTSSRPVPCVSRKACGGRLPGPDNGINGYLLAVGASAWLTVTVDVLTGCPTPLHLTILLDYGQTGHAATTMLEAFPDLSGGTVATTSYRLKGVIRR